MFIYAAHDITICIFFTLLDVWERTIPPVGSYAMFELHNINGTYGFKVRKYSKY